MSKRLLYQEIQQAILDDISKGVYQQGDRIPTEAMLSEQYGVSRITVQHAMMELKERGILTRHPRTGTFVAVTANSWKAELPKKISVVAPFNLGKGDIYAYLPGMMGALGADQGKLSLHDTDYDPQLERTTLERCMQDGTDGILYYPGQEPPIDLLVRIAAQKYPLVLLDKRVHSIDFPCVQSDNLEGAKALTRYAINHGHTRFAYAAEAKLTISSLQERYCGFCQALADASLNVAAVPFCSLAPRVRPKDSYVVLAKAEEEQIHRWLSEWMNKGITTIQCDTDKLAMAIFQQCAAEGIRVPEDLSILGFDGLDCGRMTSMLQDFSTIGQKATELLLKWVTTGQCALETVLVPTKLLPGTTVANLCGNGDDSR